MVIIPPFSVLFFSSYSCLFGFREVPANCMQADNCAIGVPGQSYSVEWCFLQ